MLLQHAKGGSIGATVSYLHYIIYSPCISQDSTDRMASVRTAPHCVHRTEETYETLVSWTGITHHPGL